MNPNGNQYLITAMCMTLRYPDVVPVMNVKLTSIIDTLLMIFSHMGFPREKQTDQEFMRNLTVMLFQRFRIKTVRSVYHPQSNPVKKFHRTIKIILKVSFIEYASEWESHVPPALIVLQTVTHEITGFSPAELVPGRQLRSPITLSYEQ